jgi:hypothetical protein
MRLVSVVTSTRSPASTALRISPSRSSTWPARAAPRLGIDQAGRPDDLLDDHAARARELVLAGVAET